MSSYTNFLIREIPKDWKTVPLGKYVNISSGDSPSLINFKNFGTPYFKVEQLNNSKKYLGVFSTPYYFSGRKTVSANSVIFPKRGAAIALNKIRILETESFMDTNLMTLTAKNGLDFEFLYYQIVYLKLWRFADTASVPQINNKHINPLLFVLPKISEQRSIAEILRDVDLLISIIDKLITKKKNFKKAIIHQLLSGKTRLKGFSKSWRTTVIKEISNIYKGNGLSKTLTKSSGLRACVLYGELFTTYEKVITQVISKTDSNQGFMSEAGDILMPSSTTTTGIDLATASALLVKDVALGGDIIVIRRKTKNDYDPIFLAYYLSYIKRREIAEMTQGTTIHHLYGSAINNLLIEIPTDIKEQEFISKILLDIEEELLLLKSQLKKVLNLKNAITYKLLTGKIRLLKNKK